MNSRAETGPIQFGDDWPGFFFRGDAALRFAAHLREMIELSSGVNAITLAVMEGLHRELMSVQVPAFGPELVQLKPYTECLP